MKLEMVEGMLALGEMTLEEPPMVVYEKFYKTFMLGVQAADSQDSFIENWVWVPQFRAMMIQALAIMGIANPEMLPPSTLEQLLFTYEGGAGAIFQLCNTFPKLTRAQNPSLSPHQSLSLRLQGIMSAILCKIPRWLINGLSALS